MLLPTNYSLNQLIMCLNQYIHSICLFIYPSPLYSPQFNHFQYPVIDYLDSTLFIWIYFRGFPILQIISHSPLMLWLKGASDNNVHCSAFVHEARCIKKCMFSGRSRLSCTEPWPRPNTNTNTFGMNCNTMQASQPGRITKQWLTSALLCLKDRKSLQRYSNVHEATYFSNLLSM